jgi:hypothetical protein
MAHALLPGSPMLRRGAATLVVGMLLLLAGCVMRETYGDQGVAEGDAAVVEGYWHYRLLYDEELHIASLDGQRGGGKEGWPYAYSVSMPSGRHWLQLVIQRNSSEITRCAFEWTFEGQHRYKIQHLDHEQALLAHPAKSPFAASLRMVVKGPSGSSRDEEVSAVCGKEPMCRQPSDCVPEYSCQMSPGLAFGTCRAN